MVSASTVTSRVPAILETRVTALPLTISPTFKSKNIISKTLSVARRSGAESLRVTISVTVVDAGVTIIIAADEERAIGGSHSVREVTGHDCAGRRNQVLGHFDQLS